VADISTLPAPVKTDQHIALKQQAFADIDAAVTVGAVKHVLDQWDAIANYARKIKDNQIAADAREIRMRGERKLGEIMKAQKETVGLNQGGRPKTGLLENPVSEPKLPTLAEAGIDKNLANSARKEAAKSKEQFEIDVAEKQADILVGERKPKTFNPAPPSDIVDRCVAAVCRRVEDTITEIKHRHKKEAPQKIERLLAALADSLTDLGRKALPEDDTDASAAERKARYAAVEAQQ
jgi:hypothetical protein